MNTQNIDQKEVAHFDALAARWWDTEGDFRTLHDINPARVGWIASRTRLAGARVMDIGCGGGLLSEAMAEKGAEVTGVDASSRAITVAELHLHESGLRVEYLESTAEAIAAERAGQYDLVTCMELLEHVPDPGSVVQACAALVRPGGAVCYSTLNRTPKAWLTAILGAEYVMRLLPRGTHDYARFISPSELDRWGRSAGLELVATAGLAYNPFSRRARITSDLSVNYMAWFICRA